MGRWVAQVTPTWCQVSYRSTPATAATTAVVPPRQSPSCSVNFGYFRGECTIGGPDRAATSGAHGRWARRWRRAHTRRTNGLRGDQELPPYVIMGKAQQQQAWPGEKGDMAMELSSTSSTPRATTRRSSPSTSGSTVSYLLISCT
jgi:hypothetical protein